MSISNNEAYEQLKSYLNIDVLIPQWLPDGKRQGHEWVVRNPTRSDNKPGSFSINMIDGKWSDFAVGDAGGDLISLYAYLNRISNSESLNILSEMYGPVTGAKPVKKVVNLKEVRESYGKLLYPAPENCGKPEVKNDGIWCYKDINGRVLQYVLRFNEGIDKKTTPPYTYREKNGTCRWVKKGAEGHKKPLYGMEKLTATDKIILLVEGEKTANAAQALLPDYICMSWLGGAKNPPLVDWETLRDRVVWLWPDNDEPGFKAMAMIKDLLGEIAKKVMIIDIKPFRERKPGWDLADATSEDMPLVIQCLKHSLDKKSFPNLSAKGNILNTAANVKHLLDFYKYEIRYNCVTHRPEFSCDNGKRYSKENELECHYAAICELCVKHCVPKVDLHMWIMYIADECRYNPALDFIQSRSWDGVGRINQFLNTVNAENKELAGKLIYRWMLGAIAAASCEDGVALPGVLVFQGAQGIGKTMWFKNLIPKEYGYLSKDGLTLDPNNKDSLISCTSIWLGELGELDATFSRSAISYLKSFITKSVDYVRSPYGRTERQIPRRTAFFGSVNHSNYLVDDTGNRRWWTVAVKSINWDHGIDMQQVWAEFKFLYDEGAEFVPDADEMKEINAENEIFEAINPMEEQILARFVWDEKSRDLKITATDVLIRLGYKMDNKSCKTLGRECGAILTKLTNKKGKRIKGRTWFWLPRDTCIVPVILGV